MAIPPHSKPRHKKAPNKRSIIRWCVGTAMLTATALIISIPLIMRAEDNIQQAANVKAYAATITNTANKAIQESKRQAKLYNARLANQTSNQTDDEPATQNPDEYNRQLVIPPSDVMATINYPKLGISLPIRHGTSEQTLAIGAGHWEGTSLPIGGAGTHTVITAHRGLADKLMFTKLDQAREGDEFTITTLGETLTYQVQTIRTITPETFTWINKHDASADQATLMTCTPYGINTHRLLITGTRVPNHDECPPETGCLTDGTLSTTAFALTAIWATLTTLARHSYNEMHDRRSTLPAPRTHRIQLSQDDCKAKSTLPLDIGRQGGRPNQSAYELDQNILVGRKSRTSPTIMMNSPNPRTRARISPILTKSTMHRPRADAWSSYHPTFSAPNRPLTPSPTFSDLT